MVRNINCILATIFCCLCINTSESTYGKSLFLGNKLVIPFYNVNVGSSEDSFWNQESGNYIKYCYLIFQNVSGIVWDYDLSRLIESEQRECYGGEYYFDKKYYEFWIKYGRGFIYLDQNYQSSDVSWDDLKGKEEDFFKSNPYESS